MTYEYLCTACGHQWEAEQSISAKPLTACPKCKKQKAQRQISGGTGFVLKGSGWYADLYSSAKPDSKKSEESPAEASSGESSKDEGSKADGKKTDGGEAAKGGKTTGDQKGSSKDAKKKGRTRTA
jgi:putative FmdB family regulatory protein